MARVTNRIDNRPLIGLAVVLAAVILGGCGHALTAWVWDHPDPEYAQLYRDRDIFECEWYARDVAMDGPLHEFSNAREFGGWGNFDFEFCMNEKGWRLVQHKPARVSP